MRFPDAREAIKIGVDLGTQARRERLPFGSGAPLGQVWLIEATPRPTIDLVDAAVPGARDAAMSGGPGRKRRGLGPVAEIRRENVVVDRVGFDLLGGGVADQAVEAGPHPPVGDLSEEAGPRGGRANASARQIRFPGHPLQGGPDVRLVVGERLRGGAERPVVEARDRKPEGRPAGGQELGRPVEGLRDLAKRADPLDPPIVRQALCGLDLRNDAGKGELDQGRGRGVMVHWDDLGSAWRGSGCTGVDHHVIWDNFNSILATNTPTFRS